MIINMLFWIKLFSTILFLTLISLNLLLNSLMSIILTSEFIIILLVFLFLFNGVIFNLNWIFGFSFIILILGGLEIALSFLILNL